MRSGAKRRRLCHNIRPLIRVAGDTGNRTGPEPAGIYLTTDTVRN